jgi:hypothetical protein
MRDTPRDRYTFRAHFGSWDLYPVSPRPFYKQLVKATPFDLEGSGSGFSAFDNADSLFKLFGALEKVEAKHANDPPTLLAVRRAGLTTSSLAHHRCDDSYGILGEQTSEATLRFTRTDWRATGMDPAMFWRDVLEMFTVLGNYGVTSRHENELMANLGADRDRAFFSVLRSLTRSAAVIPAAVRRPVRSTRCDHIGSADSVAHQSAKNLASRASQSPS